MQENSNGNAVALTDELTDEQLESLTAPAENPVETVIWNFVVDGSPYRANIEIDATHEQLVAICRPEVVRQLQTTARSKKGLRHETNHKLSSFVPNSNGGRVSTELLAKAKKLEQIETIKTAVAEGRMTKEDAVALMFSL